MILSKRRGAVDQKSVSHSNGSLGEFGSCDYNAPQILAQCSFEHTDGNQLASAVSREVMQ